MVVFIAGVENLAVDLKCYLFLFNNDRDRFFINPHETSLSHED